MIRGLMTAITCIRIRARPLVTGSGSTGFAEVSKRIAIRLTEEWPAIVGDKAGMTISP